MSPVRTRRPIAASLLLAIVGIILLACLSSCSGTPDGTPPKGTTGAGDKHQDEDGVSPKMDPVQNE